MVIIARRLGRAGGQNVDFAPTSSTIAVMKGRPRRLVHGFLVCALLVGCAASHPSRRTPWSVFRSARHIGRPAEPSAARLAARSEHGGFGNPSGGSHLDDDEGAALVVDQL